MIKTLNNLLETILGFIVVFIAAAFVFFAYRSNHGQGSLKEYVLSAKFDRIDGLNIGSDVKMSGVKIGYIKEISIDPISYQAKATMHINADLKLPDDSSADISSDGLLGGKYIALIPGASETVLEDRGVIATTHSSVSFESLLSKFLMSKEEGGSADQPRQKPTSASSKMASDKKKEDSTPSKAATPAAKKAQDLPPSSPENSKNAVKKDLSDSQTKSEKEALKSQKQTLAARGAQDKNNTSNKPSAADAKKDIEEAKDKAPVLKSRGSSQVSMKTPSATSTQNPDDNLEKKQGNKATVQQVSKTPTDEWDTESPASAASKPSNSKKPKSPVSATKTKEETETGDDFTVIEDDSAEDTVENNTRNNNASTEGEEEEALQESASNYDNSLAASAKKKN